ncbi:MAG: glycolate oxidase subunit GlcD [Desulfobacca sp.]|nr:glycolate oxidase subunit GlcD [Desulfobacca sp.]
MMNKEIFKALEKIVGPQYLSDRETDLQCYAYDATQIQARPAGVVFPGSTREISEILKLANQYGFPVVPRGSGSGMSGGSVPIQGGLVLVLLRLDQIKKIDTNNLLALVEPGVITRDLQQAVEAKGLFYPPDPSSSHFSTLGGNVAECAGGGRAVKYGVTRDYVLGLEVVLPSGEIVRTGVHTSKGVVGYDLTRLMVGSEGTLGILTELALKLIPLPEARQTILAFFNQMVLATRTIVEIFQEGIRPSVLEFMDHSSIVCVEDYLHLGLPTQAQALLLIEVDGDQEAVARQGETIQRICQRIGAQGVKLATTPQEAEELWRARRSISPAVFRLRPNKINEDIVVPRDKIPEAIEGFQGIGHQYDLLIVSFGHAGDGNIHVNVMYDKKNPAEKEKAYEAVVAVFKKTLELGGTISGEHGIGLTKAPFLAMELDPVSLTLMKKIKDLFDPNHILNPGKIFPSD